ncbi:Rossmann-like and DUF2520 domain-containing protein [Prevotella aurantiaca]|uniref:Rossmann-like and DUF2520 domain-containing protein n=1 Tax=Prevotella aurantiaca TaxID=596085 RepID=UPI0028DBC9FC|nr:DUF2520 domain-containing protein [Prevotella aurantiaca]
MKIALIGAGNLATVLGHALYNAKHDIVQVYSRTMAAAKQLAERLNAVPTDDLETITNDADLYIIALKDSVLDEVIGKICPNRSEKLFVHTAGSMPIDVFRGRTKRYGVLYPMQTFSKTRIVDFRNIPVFVEANSISTMQTIIGVAQSVSDNVQELSSADRRYLHLAAVWACNYVNHCYDLAAEVLQKVGLPFDVMLPLTDETARKVHELSPREAQTGPAIRYDENIIEAQMQLMNDNPKAQKIYELMAKSIHEKSKK